MDTLDNDKWMRVQGDGLTLIVSTSEGDNILEYSVPDYMLGYTDFYTRYLCKV